MVAHQIDVLLPIVYYDQFLLQALDIFVQLDNLLAFSRSLAALADLIFAFNLQVMEFVRLVVVLNPQLVQFLLIFRNSREKLSIGLFSCDEFGDHLLHI